MAETLAQAPSRARTAPQISVETQRLEELAIKQSRQLIPLTLSTPKALVMSVKALGTSLKLTFEGNNQLIFPETWFFMLVAVTCVITQMNYLNKALDTFNTAIVSPICYVMFTTLTILASVIMFKDWDGQSGGDIISEICGFVVVLSGTILLHATKDFEKTSSFRCNYMPVSPSLSAQLRTGNGELHSHDEEDQTSSVENSMNKSYTSGVLSKMLTTLLN